MSEEADKTDKIRQFTSITGANEEQARFFLESHNWQVELAIPRFFDNELRTNDVEDASNDEVASSPVSASNPSKQRSKPRNSNIATFSTLNAASSDEEEEGQAYYAGGSTHSGQQVLGPPKKKKDIVGEMFKSVQEHGELLDSVSASSSSSRAFRGTGYKLGQDNNDSEVIPGAVDPPQPREVTLSLWQNGFSVNDGELRAYNDPRNEEFLESIRRGEIPMELRQGNAEVHLAMEDHRMEAYKPRARKVVRPFEGQGYTLGSPAPPVVGACREEDKPANEAKAKEGLKLDTSKPLTNLQIRLADGSRLVGQFNHEHTVAQVRSYIVAARPQYQTQPFNLLSTYPSKLLNDSETLAEAGLLNAAIMQKLV